MNFAYDWAFARPIRNVYYNLTMTGLSVFVTLFIGTIELLGLLGLLGQEANLTSAFWTFMANFNINTAEMGPDGRQRIAELTSLGSLPPWAQRDLLWRPFSCLGHQEPVEVPLAEFQARPDEHGPRRNAVPSCYKRAGPTAPSLQAGRSSA